VFDKVVNNVFGKAHGLRGGGCVKPESVKPCLPDFLALTAVTDSSRPACLPACLPIRSSELASLSSSVLAAEWLMIRQENFLKK